MSLGAAFLLTLGAAATTLGLVALGALVQATASSIPFEEAANAVVRDPVNLGLAQAGGVGLALVIGLRVFAPSTGARRALALIPLRMSLLALAVLSGLTL